MAKASLDLIKKLRRETQAPVMECQQALVKFGGDLAKAKKWLKKKGLARAKKKKSQRSEEGLIHAYVHNNGRAGAIVKISCQTDFVGRNPDFAKLAHEIALQIVALKPKNVRELLSQEYIRDPEKKIEELINGAIAKFGENIRIVDFTRLEIETRE